MIYKSDADIGALGIASNVDLMASQVITTEDELSTMIQASTVTQRTLPIIRHGMVHQLRRRQKSSNQLI